MFGLLQALHALAGAMLQATTVKKYVNETARQGGGEASGGCCLSERGGGGSVSHTASKSDENSHVSLTNSTSDEKNHLPVLRCFNCQNTNISTSVSLHAPLGTAATRTRTTTNITARCADFCRHAYTSLCTTRAAFRPRGLEGAAAAVCTVPVADTPGLLPTIVRTPSASKRQALQATQARLRFSRYTPIYQVHVLL